MLRVVGITGTPGVGKKSISPLVASSLGVQCFSLNEFAASYGMLEGGEGDLQVDPKALGRRIGRSLDGRVVLHGHLLPYALDPACVSSAVVLRCEPRVLRARLRDRGYPEQKVAENVGAELIGLIAADARRIFGRKKVKEFDASGGDLGASAAKVAALVSGKSPSSPIDWLGSYAAPTKLRSLLGPPG